MQPPDTVLFPEILNAEAVEHTIARRRGVESFSNQLIVDLSTVRWCEAYALSLLLVWLHTMATRTPPIRVRLPLLTGAPHERRLPLEHQERLLEDRAAVYAFLIRIRFLASLSSLGITYDDLPPSLQKMTPKPLHDSISPLSFFDEPKAFHELLDRLLSPEAYSAFFLSADRYRIVSTRRIRDYVLRELGNNLFEHAGGQFAHLVMNETTASSKSTNSWEDRFRSRLGNDRYLELVISDAGPGIFKTLSEAYSKDPLLPSRARKPSDCDVLAYSILQHSTRKTDAEKLDSVVQTLATATHLSPIATTGLYWVKETCREFRGFFSIRSGTCLLTYDFLTEPLQSKPTIVRTSSAFDSTLALSQLPGVQVKLCFPLLEAKEDIDELFLQQVRGPSQKRKYLLIVSEPLSTSPASGAADHARYLVELISRIHQKRLSESHSKIIVVDLSSFPSDPKLAFLLALELMRLQDRHTTIIATHADAIVLQKAQIGSTLEHSDVALRPERPLAALDSSFQLHVLGDPSAVENLLLFIGDRDRGSQAKPEHPIPSLVASLNHLLEGDPRTDYHSTFSLDKLQELALEASREALASLLKEPADSIFYPQGWHLLPSGSYVKGFFAIRNLLAKPRAAALLSQWLRESVRRARPDVLVTLGSVACDIVTRFRSDLPDCQLVQVPDPDDPRIWMKATLLEPGSKLLLFTDVIASGRALTNLIQKLALADVAAVLTVVDARRTADADTLRVGTRTYGLRSVHRHPIDYAESLPAGSTYRDVVLVDPDSTLPVLAPVQLEGPLWPPDVFFNNLVRPSAALAIGHFASTNKHITYLLGTPALAEMFGVQVADRIVDDLRELYKRHRLPHELDVVFVPEQSPGTEIIAAHIAHSFPGCRVLLIPSASRNRHSATPSANDVQVKNAVLIDDACSSGNTLKRLLTAIEKWGAERVFVYLLLNRCTPQDARFLEGIGRFGGSEVEVRFGVNLFIPAYDAAVCPVCRASDEVEQLAARAMPYPRLADHLRSSARALLPQSIGLTLNPATSASYFAGDIEPRLLQLGFRRDLALVDAEPDALKRLLKTLTQRSRQAQLMPLFHAIALEKHLYIGYQGQQAKSLPSHLRRAILRRAQNLMKRGYRLAPHDLDAVASVLRLCDEDVFIDEAERLLLDRRATEEVATLLCGHLFGSKLATRDPIRLDGLLARHLSDKDPPRRLLPEPRPNRPIAAQYMELLWKLGPSWGYASPLDALLCRLEWIASGDSDVTDTHDALRTLWDETYRRLTDEDLLDLAAFASLARDRRLSLDVASRLSTQVQEIRSLAEQAAALRKDAGFEGVALLDLLKALIPGFQRLRWLLCDDGPGTLHETLLDMKTELRFLVRNVVNQERLRQLLEQHRVKPQLLLPSQATYVFGHASEIGQAVHNLVENIAHGFKDAPAYVPRLATIQVQKQSAAGTVSFIVRDSGRARFPVEQGKGLKRAELIASSLGGRLVEPRPVRQGVLRTEVRLDLPWVSEDIVGFV